MPLCCIEYDSMCAVQDSETETEAAPVLQNEDAEGEWVPVCKPEEVPKGVQNISKLVVHCGMPIFQYCQCVDSVCNGHPACLLVQATSSPCVGLCP